MEPIGRLARGFGLTVALLALVASSAEATAITIDGIGDAFSVDFTGVSGTGNEYPVSVESDWLTTGFTTTSVTFLVTLLNTSETDPARLTGFGFDTDPDATSGSSTSLLFPYVGINDLSSFRFDVCVDNGGGEGCTGNIGNGGLGVGDPAHTFDLTLYFSDTSGGVSFSNFGARLQGIGPGGGDSAKIFGDPIPECTIGCDVDVLVAVPEPATLLLVGSGAALALRRRLWRRV